MALHFDLFLQCQVTGVSGQSGLLAPGPVGQSLCLATGGVAVLSPRPEEQPAPENRKYTMELAFKSRDSPVLLLPSVQVRCHQWHLCRRFVVLQSRTWLYWSDAVIHIVLRLLFLKLFAVRSLYLVWQATHCFKCKSFLWIHVFHSIFLTFVFCIRSIVFPHAFLFLAQVPFLIVFFSSLSL